MRAITTMLSETEKEKIHLATLEVLERVGVHIGSDEMRRLMAGKGAKVIGENVRFPSEMVNEMLLLVNQEIILAARDSRYSFSIPAGEFPYLTTVGYVPFVTDEGAAKPRKATRDDLEKFARLADAIDAFGFFWPIVLPNDCEADFMEFQAVETSFYHTGKHIQASVSNGEMAAYQIELAAVLAGGKERLRKAPLLSLLAAPTSPLAIEAGIADAIMVCARHGIPVVPMALPQMGSTSPATYAGNTIVANAEVLACYIAAKCADEHAPILYSTDTGAPNLMNMALNYDNPEYYLLSVANADMARYYKLPGMVASGMNERKEFDTYAGFERNVFKAAMALMTRTDLACTYGSVDSCLSSSFAAVILDTEAYHFAKSFLRSYSMDTDKMAVDIICEVGPRGNYLAHDHTFKHFRDEINHAYIDRSFVLQSKQKNGYRQLALEKAREIWEHHQPLPISPDVSREMKCIRQAARKAILGQ